MIKELDKAIQTAKTQWSEMESKLAAQERLMSAAAEQTQEHEEAIKTRDEEIERLMALSKLSLAQRDEAQYNLGRTATSLQKSEREVLTLQDDVRKLDRQVGNLKATMGLENA